MKKRTFALLTAAMTTGLMVLSLAPAYADHDDTQTANSSVSMTYKKRAGKFVGAVSSGHNRCVGNRSVKVYKIRRDGSHNDLGTVKTARDGSWSFVSGKVFGKFGATAAPKTITLESGVDEYGVVWKHILKCGSGSDTVKIARR